MRHSHIDQVWWALRVTYGLVAFLAGLDKFFNLLTNWEKATGCPIYEGVGMSEGAPYANNPVTGKRKVLSVGLPPPETDVDEMMCSVSEFMQFNKAMGWGDPTATNTGGIVYDPPSVRIQPVGTPHIGSRSWLGRPW